MALIQDDISPHLCFQLSVISGSSWSRNSLDYARFFPFSTGARFKFRHSRSSIHWSSSEARVTSRKHERVPSYMKKMLIENLWLEFFSDPSLWWDHREKGNERYPDFKHKKKHLALWLNSYLTPPWVGEKLAAMASGTVQENVFSWNKRLDRCMKAGYYEEAIHLFQQMEQEGIDPDQYTLVAVLNACAKAGALEDGVYVHQQLIRTGHESNVFVGNSLVDMYAKCGRIEDAWRVFQTMPTRTVVSWSAMIHGYVKCGEGQKALELYRRMQKEDYVDPNLITFLGVLNACASVAALEEGRCVHERIKEKGYENDVYVSTCLVDMYAKCGSIEDARRVFEAMPTRNVVSWSAMIQGYVKCQEGQKALELFRRIQDEKGVEPNSVMFVGVLNACASVAALEEGRRVHAQIIKRGYENDLFLGNCLVDMYAKCGSIEDARRVFNEMPTTDVVSWNAMIAGYGKHGYAREALEHFKLMSEVVNVDPVTFISLLSACSHDGLVDEGMFYFKSMSAVYNISPMVDHYACIIDLLGRAGRLHDAEDLIRTMPCEPDGRVWMSLLGVCRVHRNVPVGERVIKRFLELEPDNVAAHAVKRVLKLEPDNDAKMCCYEK